MIKKMSISLLMIVAVFSLGGVVHGETVTKNDGSPLNYINISKLNPPLFQIIEGANTGTATGTDGITTITTNTQNVRGSIWSNNNYKMDLTRDFTITMDLNFGTGTGDGMAFVMTGTDPNTNKPVADSSGKFSGARLGVWGYDRNRPKTGLFSYATPESGAIKKSVAVEFDTYMNVGSQGGPFDEQATTEKTSDHIAWAFPDSSSSYAAVNTDLLFPSNNTYKLVHNAVNSGVNLRDGDWHVFNVNWSADRKTLSYTIDNQGKVVIPVGDHLGTSAWWGFTGSNGELTEQNQVIFAQLPDVVTGKESGTLNKMVNNQAQAVTAGELLPKGTQIRYNTTLERVSGRVEWQHLNEILNSQLLSQMDPKDFTITIDNQTLRGDSLMAVNALVKNADGSYRLSLDALGGSSLPVLSETQPSHQVSWNATVTKPLTVAADTSDTAWFEASNASLADQKIQFVPYQTDSKPSLTVTGLSVNDNAIAGFKPDTSQLLTNPAQIQKMTVTANWQDDDKFDLTALDATILDANGKVVSTATKADTALSNTTSPNPVAFTFSGFPQLTKGNYTIRLTLVDGHGLNKLTKDIALVLVEPLEFSATASTAFSDNGKTTLTIPTGSSDSHYYPASADFTIKVINNQTDGSGWKLYGRTAGLKGPNNLVLPLYYGQKGTTSGLTRLSETNSLIKEQGGASSQTQWQSTQDNATLQTAVSLYSYPGKYTGTVTWTLAAVPKP